MKNDNNIVAYNYKIEKKQRTSMNGHLSFLVLFTGLSGSGKSTLANALEYRLFNEKKRTYVLDGDNIRKGINQNLGFSPEDRSENNRRIGEISKLFVDAGQIVLAAFICPYKKDRDAIERLVGPDNFFEVFVDTPLEECERRDPKGLYQRARAGKISNMTGISAPYEIPKNYDVVITPEYSVDEAVQIIYDTIKHKLY